MAAKTKTMKEMPEHNRLRSQAAAVCHHLRIVLRQRNWQGVAGQWAGKNSGSSIDFQDHRPYLPGDDPRHIDWAAYARSGHYIMKLYREEVSPKVDLLLDFSSSMYINDAKRDRTFELLYFCAESILAINATLHVYTLERESARRIELPQLLRANWIPPAAETKPSRAITNTPLRSRSLRILISDLLFEDEPQSILRPLCAHDGSAMILAPFAQCEETPEWNGNVELIDCESGSARRQRVVPGLLARYQKAYAKHMDTWRAEARHLHAAIARIPTTMPLAEALRAEAIPQGMVEIWT
jgi:uncharacterized protein (DUF58 family)